MSEIVGRPGIVKLLMGNEAIARGVIEAGVNVVTGYPGTPSSEVIMALASVAGKLGMRIEWSINEKVALEIASGVAFAGLRAMVTMKNVGLNVASDPLMSIAYSGVNGELVIYVADDPAVHSGMEEQDNRLFTKISLLPMIEPCDPQEAKDAVIEAFKLSEKLRIPVLLRTTTRVAHMTGNVKFGSVSSLKRKPSFTRSIERFTKASPKWCMEQHTLLNQKLETAKQLIKDSKLNRLELIGDHITNGIIASGIAWNYLKDVIAKYDLTGLALLKIGTINPLPEYLISEFMNKVGTILILEELEPYIEMHVKAMASELDKRLQIHGKLDGTTSRVGEFDGKIVAKALEKLLGRQLMEKWPEQENLIQKAHSLAPRRQLTFCPGCPHCATYLAIDKAIRKLGYSKDDVIITGDIGCTILGMNPPFNLCWTETCMGASISLASGLRYAGIEKPIIATIGDSTFFHAGIPALINASWHGTNIVIAVLDNQLTAMTGHQPDPGSGYTTTGETAKRIKIEDIARASGIDSVVTVDPYQLEEAIKAFVDALSTKGPAVIVLRRLCSLEAKRRRLAKRPLYVDLKKCTGCLFCIKTLACPAMRLTPEGKVEIDSEQCVGCGLCAKICPLSAIILVEADQ